MGSAKQQGAVWGARAQDWASANEPAWTAVFDAVLDGAGVGAGTRMLDIGCGAGGALVLARKRGAVATGLDAAAALAAIARERLPGAEIAVGEMEELPFADAAFDAVTGINSFQFAQNPAAALAEAGRVCRKGGTIAMLVWGRPEDCELLSKVVLPAVFPLVPPPAPDAPPMLRLAEPGVIEGLLTQAGLTLVSSNEFSAPLEFADHPQAVRAVMSASARAIMHSGEEQVRAAVGAALQQAVQADGRVRLNNRFRLTLAQPA